MLGACGGGSGGGVRAPSPPPVAAPPITTPPAPDPVPAPTPTPAPAPPPSSFDTPEYRATVGAVSLNALAAYNAGATGRGIGVGVIDSGITASNPEFENRVSAASADVASDRGPGDESGHGTAVAFTIAGRRNGSGTQGVAFESTLVVARADSPGSCATERAGDDDSGCRFSDRAIAAGLDVARGAGARVINVSLGGSGPDATLLAAIDRATQAGIIIVIAAGNDAAANPDPLALVANDPVARGLVIVAGSVDSNGSRTPGADTISTFGDKDGSNRAGIAADHFLAAVGQEVRAPDQTGAPFIWSGTSFSAPQISGAIALLAQAFPNLSGAQIVDILYRSARDAGAAGTDPVYGRGVLDLTRAFQPLGSSSVAGQTATVSLVANGTLSAAMGDAAQSGLGAVILDGYGRAFAVDLAPTITRAPGERRLTGALASPVRSMTAAIGGTSVAMTVAPAQGGAAVSRLFVSRGEAEGARAIAGMVTQRLGSTAEFALGFSQGAGAVTARLAGQQGPAFLIARGPGSGTAFDWNPGGSAAARQRFGRLGVTAAMERGTVPSRDGPAQGADWRRSPYDRAAVTLDRRFGPVSTWLTGARTNERETLLGGRLSSALGKPGATSWSVDAVARVDAGAGWALGGSLRQGWTRARLTGGLSGIGLLRSDAWALDLGKTGVLGGDSIGLRVAQPLRVASGGLDLALPTSYDYATRSVDAWTTQRLNLAPTGREIDMEWRYSLALPSGALHTNLFWRRDPGNIAGAADDYGVAVRYALGF